MTRKYSLAVMAHESRADFFDYLKEQLGKVPFLVDKGKLGQKGNLGIWGNCRRSWLKHKDKEWHFVIQDDAILTSNFHEKLDQLLERVGNDDVVIALYVGRNAERLVKIHRKRDNDHFLDGRIFNEVALGMRTKHIKSLVKTLDEWGATSDSYIERWAKQNKLHIYYPIPSLVDHRNSKSIYRSQKGIPEYNPRKAVWFEE